MIIADGDKGYIDDGRCKFINKATSIRSWKDGIMVCKSELPVSIKGVENMCRWINVRDAAGGSKDRDTDTNEPLNLPDSYSNGKQLVFVHGFNVNEDQARGWNAEIFKRLYQAGSRAMFTAATWFGNDSQIASWLPILGDISPNYYINVEHAFESASSLVSEINTLPGQKCIAAHSLGNMLVSSAIKDEGLIVTHYFMLNAAVAKEAYDPSIMEVADMQNPNWNGYLPRLWASEWYSLFSGTDGRGKLTWRDRFGNIGVAYYYYSSTEDVLNTGNGALPSLGPERVWVNQEMRKGTWLITVGPGNSEAGWGFNNDYSGLTVAEANALPDATLMANSFFAHFDDEDLYGSSGSTIAATPAMYRQLLADAIPAISNPMGGDPISGFGSGSTDLTTMRRGDHIDDDWPRDNDRWIHSDIKNIAYPFNYPAFDRIVQDGGLR